MPEPTATGPDPVRQVIDRIDEALAVLPIRIEILNQVRDWLTAAVGEQTGGSRPGDRA